MWFRQTHQLASLCVELPKNISLEHVALVGRIHCPQPLSTKGIQKATHSLSYPLYLLYLTSAAFGPLVSTRR